MARNQGLGKTPRTVPGPSSCTPGSAGLRRDLPGDLPLPAVHPRSVSGKTCREGPRCSLSPGSSAVCVLLLPSAVTTVSVATFPRGHLSPWPPSPRATFPCGHLPPWPPRQWPSFPVATFPCGHLPPAPPRQWPSSPRATFPMATVSGGLVVTLWGGARSASSGTAHWLH